MKSKLNFLFVRSSAVASRPNASRQKQHAAARGRYDMFVNRLGHYLGLSVVVLIAASLRFFKLGTWSFWIDEIFTIQAAQNVSMESLAWPRVSLILTSLFLRMTDVSEWNARLVPALIGIITVPVLYILARRLFDRHVGLAAALLLAISPWHIFWSQNARFYTSLLLLCLLAMLTLYVGIEKDRPWHLVASLVLFGLAAIERFTALLMAPAVVCYLILVPLFWSKERPRGFRIRNLLILTVPAIAIGFLEGYSYIANGASMFFGTLDQFIFNPIDDPLRLATFIGFSFGIPLMVLSFFGGMYLLLQKSRLGLLLFLGAFLPVVLLTVLSPFIFTKDRYVFMTLPFYVVLAAVAIREMMVRYKGAAVALAIGVLAMLVGDAVGDNLLYYQINHGNRRDWKGAFAMIQAQGSPGDVIVATRQELGAYYLDETVQWMSHVTPEAVLAANRRYWFVTDSESVWVSGPIWPWIREHGELIDIRYLRIPEDISLRIYLYDPDKH